MLLQFIACICDNHVSLTAESKTQSAVHLIIHGEQFEEWIESVQNSSIYFYIEQHLEDSHL